MIFQHRLVFVLKQNFAFRQGDERTSLLMRDSVDLHLHIFDLHGEVLLTILLLVTSLIVITLELTAVALTSLFSWSLLSSILSSLIALWKWSFDHLWTTAAWLFDFHDLLQLYFFHYFGCQLEEL